MRYFDFRNEPCTQCVCISLHDIYITIRPGNLTMSYEPTVIGLDFKDENIFTLAIFKRHSVCYGLRHIMVFQDDKNKEIR